MMACGGPAAKRQIVSERDSGKVIKLRTGDILELRFPHPARGGARIVDVLFDSRILALDSKREQPPETAPVPKLGDFGTVIYEFKAVGSGESDLAIQIGQDVEGKQRILEYLKIRAVVAR